MDAAPVSAYLSEHEREPVRFRDRAQAMKLFAVTLAIVLAAAHAMAADYKVGSIEINAAWTRATPKGAEVAGAYMTITNTGATTDRLLAGSSPVAGHFELHMMTMDDGVMKMRPLTGGLEIKPGA